MERIRKLYIVHSSSVKLSSHIICNYLGVIYILVCCVNVFESVLSCVCSCVISTRYFNATFCLFSSKLLS